MDSSMAKKKRHLFWGRRIVGAVLVLSLGTISPTAGADQYSTEKTQIANGVKLWWVVLRTYQQLQNLRKNTRSLKDFVSDDSYAHLAALAEVASQEDGMSYATADVVGVFDETFKDLGHYQYEYSSSLPLHSVLSQFQEWSSVNNGTVRGTIGAAALQHEQMAEEIAKVELSESLSASAGGRKQAIQAGNQLIAHQVKQTQKLRELQMAELQMETTALASQNEKEAIQQRAEELYFDPATSGVIVGNGKKY